MPIALRITGNETLGTAGDGSEFQQMALKISRRYVLKKLCGDYSFMLFEKEGKKYGQRRLVEKNHSSDILYPPKFRNLIMNWCNIFIKK